DAELPLFAQLEDQRSSEGLRDAVRKERRFLLRFWDPGCVRCSSGSLDDGHACDAAASRRRCEYFGQLNQVCNQARVLVRPTTQRSAASGASRALQI